MLAAAAQIDKLRFPLLASPKLDGVRAIVRNGVVLSRSLKPIPNRYVQRLFGSRYEHSDGELIVGAPTSPACYRDTVSGVMSEDGEPDVKFWQFDHIADPSSGYEDRWAKLKHSRYAPILESIYIGDIEALLMYEQECLRLGYEGVILRDPDAPYKFNRSTVREGYLLKLKRFEDAEAVVIGFEERMHNGNEATVSELGRTKRSTHQAGKVGRGDLGALLVRTGDGVEFSIGTGFSDAERAALWRDRDHLLGKIAKFKSFPIGVKEAPRHPVFLGWRHSDDL
jgi:DNA ligase-1